MAPRINGTSADVKRKKIKIGVDLDGVIFDFNTQFVALAKEMFPHINPPQPSFEWPTHWDYMDDFLNKNETRQLWARIVNDPHFWADLPTYPYTLEMGELIEDIVDQTDGDIYFITSRVGPKVSNQAKWALQQIGWTMPSVMAVDNAELKLPIAKALKLTHFIDDKPETVNMMKNARIDVAVWDQPWNRDHGVFPTIPRLKNLEDMRDWLS